MLMNNIFREMPRRRWISIILLYLLIYLIVLECRSYFATKCIFCVMYLLFNVVICSIIVKKIYTRKLNDISIVYAMFVIFNAITYFNNNRDLLLIHSGEYSAKMLLLMVMPAFVGVVISLLLMRGALYYDREKALKGLVAFLFLISSSAFFFSVIYGYAYEEFFHGSYDLFIDMHESAIGNAKNLAILKGNFLLYSFDCMLGRNYSNISLSFIDPPDKLSTFQLMHIENYDPANRWLFVLKVISELESFIFILYISFIAAEMFKVVIERKK